MPNDLASRPSEASRTRRTHHSLVFVGSGLGDLREELLAEAPLETARFLFARPVLAPSGAWRLVVYDSVAVAEQDYEVRSEVALRIPPSVVADVMRRARSDNSSIVLAHSHPFAGELSPSAQDLAGEELLLPAFRRRVPGVPHARLIVGNRDLHARLFGPDGEESALEVVEVGNFVGFGAETDVIDEPMANASGRRERYERQVRAFGEDGQRQLARLRVAIVGLGGTGSVVAQQLAHLGVGSFILIDSDVIETTNLNRVMGARRVDVGRPKVDVARDMILGVNPDAMVEPLRADVRDKVVARRVLDADVFMLCTDSQGSRAVMSQMAYQYAVPGIDVGVAIHLNDEGISHISGRVQMLSPGLPCLLCCDILDPEEVRRDLLSNEAKAADPYIVGAPTPQPAVVSINGAASSLAVTMLLSAITGVPYASRNQRLRLESGVVSRVEVEPRENCPICSARGALARGDSWPTPGRGA